MEKMRFMTANVDVVVFDVLLDHIHFDANISGQPNGPFMFPTIERGFEDNGRFLFHYMVGTLNTRFFYHSQKVAEENGWEVLRVIIELMDKPPDNAKFQSDMNLNQVINDKDGKPSLANMSRT